MSSTSSAVVLRDTQGHRRMRLGVLLRLGLLGPHVLMLCLRGLLMPVAIIIAWWCALVAGRVPRRLRHFLSSYARYHARVWAFALLTADPFPGFTAKTTYPVDLEIPERERFSRLRVLLYLPLLAWLALTCALALLCLSFTAPIAWAVSLIAGRMPPGMQAVQRTPLAHLSAAFAFATLATDRLRPSTCADGPRWTPAPLAHAGGPPARRSRLALAAGIAVALAALIAGVSLWDTVVPGDLAPADLRPGDYFKAGYLDEVNPQQDRTDAWLLVGRLAALLALVAFAVRGSRLVANSAAGPIGTGMYLGMLGLGLAELLAAPFVVVALGQGSGVEGAFEMAVSPLLGVMATGGLVIAVAMAAARFTRRGWWVAAAPALVALSAGATLLGSTVDFGPRLKDPALLAHARELAARQGVPAGHVRFIDMRGETADLPVNGFTTGGAGSSEIVLIGALDSPRELRMLLAHEIGHVAGNHIWKTTLWQALFLLLAGGLVQLALRRRRAMTDPRALPLALLVVSIATLAWSPIDNSLSRRYEAEADWMALQSARDPGALTSLMREITTGNEMAPSRQGWARAMFETHPDTMDRIAMAEAWEKRRRRGL